MLKSRVAHGYCIRRVAAGACAYANVCEQCDNYLPAPEFTAVLQAQLGDIQELRTDAEERGWTREVDRHQHVIERIEAHLAHIEIR